MPNQSKLELIITTDATGAVTGIARVGEAAKKAEADTTSTFARLKSEWLGVSAAAYGALKTIEQGWAMAKAAADYQEQHAALSALAGRYNTTGAAIRDSLVGATNGMLSLATASRLAGEAMLRGMGPAQMAELAAGAKALSEVTGGDAATAFSNLTRAISTGREQSVEAALGMIDLTAKYGLVAEKWSESEKQAARYALIVERLKELQDTLGEGADSTADKMERFMVELENLRLLAGEGLIRAFMGLYGVLQMVDSGILQIVAGAATLVSYVGWITDKLNLSTRAFEDWQDVATTSWTAAGTLADDAVSKVTDAFSKWDEKTKAYKPPDLVDLGAAQRAQREVEKLTAQLAQLEAVIKSAGAYSLEDQLEAEIARITATKLGQLSSLKDAGIKNADEEAKMRDAIERAANAQIQRARADSAEKIREQNTKIGVASIDVLMREESLYAATTADTERGAIDLLRQRVEFSEEWVGTTVPSMTQLLADTVNTSQISAEWREREAAALQTSLDLQRESAAIQKSSYDAAWQQMFDMANATGGETGAAMGGFFANLKGISDIAAGEDPYTAQLQKTIEHYDNVVEAKKQGKASELQVENAYNAMMLQADKTYENQKVAVAGQAFGAMSNMMLAFYNASGQKNDALFVAFKAFKVAETLINTYSAAMGAYNAMASIPYVGPALGAIAAAAAIAFGMMQVSQIVSMKPGGAQTGAGGAPSVPQGGYGLTSPNAPTYEPTAAKATEAPIAINVSVYGSIVDHDAFAREIVGSLRKAQEDKAQ